jgi:hypothetical protein
VGSCGFGSVGDTDEEVIFAGPEFGLTGNIAMKSDWNSLIPGAPAARRLMALSIKNFSSRRAAGAPGAR